MTYRFDFEKTDEETIIESINRANKTNFKVNDFIFGEIDTDGDYTLLSLTDITNNTESIRYLRFDIGQFFANIPLVVDGIINEPSDLLNLLLSQRRLYLDSEKVTIEDISILPNNLQYKIIILPNNLCWVGEVIVKVRPTLSLNGRSIKQKMDIYRNYGNTDDLKTPIDLVYKTLVDPSNYYQVFNRYLPNDILGSRVDILEALKDITGDNWIYSDIPSSFNLKGSTIVYRGPNYGDNYNGNPRASHLLKILLGNLCSNLYGELTIEYVDPNQSKYYNMNIDSVWSTQN